MKKRILLLEDNAQTMTILEKLILDLEYKACVIKTDSVDKAYRYALEKAIDVFVIDIILDTSTPGDTSGICFAQKIRELPKYLFTPIIFVTALADPELYAYRNIHCFGYIEKPFSAMQVCSLLEKALVYTTDKDEDKVIYMRKDGILYSVQKMDIICVQVQHHVMKLFLRKGNMEVPYKTIKAFLNEIDSDDMLQCNRYTVINRQYIENVDLCNRYIMMKGMSRPVEIGIAYKQGLIKKLNVI